MSSFATHATSPVPSPFTSAIEAPDELDEDMLRRINGHFVKGHKQDLHPHGAGEYLFRNGCIYTGNFHEGMFDGAGTLTFPSGARFVAQWSLGLLVSGVYFFKDELEYLPRNWQYCTQVDRRFWSEIQLGIRFEELPQLTDSGERDTKSLPYGCYDLGDCYLDPKENRLWNYDGSYYRDPTPEELTWAKRKARLGLDKPDAAAAK